MLICVAQTVQKKSCDACLEVVLCLEDPSNIYVDYAKVVMSLLEL